MSESKEPADVRPRCSESDQRIYTSHKEKSPSQETHGSDYTQTVPPLKLASIDNSQGSDTLVDWIMTNNIGLLSNHVHTRIRPCLSTSLLDLTLTSQDIFPWTNFHVHPDCFDSDNFPISIYVESLQLEKTRNFHHRPRIHWDKATKQFEQ
ncbi:hypothetical protein AVEN_141978-1 [Araneus ventricosus]|uniref:Endonuclease/exonuclease/phosphatase domain-containing protein n=1 Tax=Araneus ventricosus TaxID=182803 RepID=A0A4Y2N392_ARAVE|nr:hypothetical protein AVEN_141978-1 [Araneus ventricosus]